MHIHLGFIGHCKGIRGVQKAEKIYENKGPQYKKNIMSSWDLEVEWKYESEYLIPLSVLKF